MDDKNRINNDYLEDNISYETYKLLLESQKEKEINDLIENNNLSIQEKIIINLERELSQLYLEQKNILYSNDEMLKLYPNDKDIIESREINLNIYKKNEIRIKEIKEKINIFNKNVEEEKREKIVDNNIKLNNKDDININKNNDKKDDILEEIEL